MNKNSRKLILILAANVLLIMAAGAQSVTEDMLANNIDGFNRKVELTELDLSKGTYIADYLRSTIIPKIDNVQTVPYSQAMLDNLITKGANIETPDQYGLGPLFWAVYSDNYSAVKTLIAAKANVNAKWTPSKKVGRNIELSEYDFTISSINYYNKTTKNFIAGSGSVLVLRPLSVGLYRARPDVVKMLIAAGADPAGTVYKNANTGNDTVFDLVCGMLQMTASKQENLFYDAPVYFATGAISETLPVKEAYADWSHTIPPYVLANCAYIWRAITTGPAADRPSPSVLASYSKTIYGALCSDDSKSVKTLLADPQFDAKAFLPYCVLCGNWEVIDFILQYNNMTIDDKVDDYNTLIDLAVMNNDSDAVKMMYDNGASIKSDYIHYEVHADYANPVSRNALEYAVDQGDEELVKTLIDMRLDPNVGSPLYFAAWSLTLTQMLKEAGANLDSAFYKVIGYVYTSDAVIDYYLSNGVNCNGIVADEQPLYEAISLTKLETVKGLLAHGADVRLVLLDAKVFEYTEYYAARYKPAIEFAKVMLDTLTKQNSAKRPQAAAILKLVTVADAAAVSQKPFEIAMIQVKGGTFKMGKADDPDNPVHDVTLSDFTVSEVITPYDIYNAGISEKVRWLEKHNLNEPIKIEDDQAAILCNELSIKNGLTPVYTVSEYGDQITINSAANGYRLATEAEMWYVASMKEYNYLLGGEKEVMTETPWDANTADAVTDPRKVIYKQNGRYTYIDVENGNVNRRMGYTGYSSFCIVKPVSK